MSNLSLTNGVETDLDKIAADTLEYGAELGVIDQYLQKGEIPADQLPATRIAMAKSIRGLRVDLTKPINDLDEYMALAYGDALRRQGPDADDPIDAIRQKALATWDFTIDPLETAEERGIVRENIKAAGALDYLYVLGEKMGIFRIVDALVLRWTRGELDLENGKATTLLYRYYKFRQERMSLEERALVFRRVLDKGDGELLPRMVSNTDFPALWDGLMSEFSTYILKLEESKGDEALISRTPIFEATKLLQTNLSEHCTGMALMQIREMRGTLEDAKAILSDPALVAAVVGGRRQSLWAAIETLAREELGYVPNTSVLQTEALQGNAVFQWVANFDRGAVSEAAFREAREAARAYIYARAAQEGTDLTGRDDAQDPDASEDSDFGDDEDDFQDF